MSNRPSHNSRRQSAMYGNSSSQPSGAHRATSSSIRQQHLGHASSTAKKSSSSRTGHTQAAQTRSQQAPSRKTYGNQSSTCNSRGG